MYELLLYTSVELYLQGVLDNYDDIVAPAGSVGTVAGLAIANYLTGSHVKSVSTVILSQNRISGIIYVFSAQ